MFDGLDGMDKANALYLAIILAYANGIANKAMDWMDDSGEAPVVTDGRIYSRRSVDQIRAEIERMWIIGVALPGIANCLDLSTAEVAAHLDVMRKSSYYDLGKRRPERAVAR